MSPADALTDSPVSPPGRVLDGPAPGLAVAAAFGRALGAAALTPFLAVGQAVLRRRLTAGVERDLATAHAPGQAPEPAVRRDRPLAVFLSCAEPSGEIHALELLARLREELSAAGAPPPQVRGLGSERLAEHGVERVGDPVARAAMGLGVIKALPFYLGLLRDAAAEFRERRPDLVIGVDSPALHVPLLRLAKVYGRLTVHFVTPQYWGWAPWRVGGYRRSVDLGLSILPFEPAWFARHRVRAEHVGHPLLDALADVPRGPLGEGVEQVPASAAAVRRLVLLPGSRRSVIRRNLPWMLARAEALRARFDDLEVVLPQDRTELEPELRQLLAETPGGAAVRLAIGDLHATLAGAHLALSVSGTVLLDLLHHRLPAVVLYRLSNRFEAFLGRHLLTVPHFSSINLLDRAEVVPEFCFAGEGPAAEVDAALSDLWQSGPRRRECLAGLERAALHLGPPGATRRAARWALSLLAPPGHAPLRPGSGEIQVGA